MKGWFVTGTDTEIGKTCVSAGLAHLLVQRGWRVGAVKPLAAGQVQDAEGRWFNEDVRHAFLEDKVVLEEVHKALKERPAALDLPLDSGPLRFRRKISQMIQAEQAVASETATA